MRSVMIRLLFVEQNGLFNCCLFLPLRPVLQSFFFFCFRLNPGLIGNPQLGVTPATPLMSVFPLRAPPANYSPYSPSR